MTEVRNLLERAKPELLKAIAQHRVDYPSLADGVESSLTKNFWVVDIPYGIMVELRSICAGAKLDFNFNDPWVWFEKK